ncbi:MAG: hypothetical protein AB8D52_10070 [Gammaproteobacteria bacterium]
MQISTPWYIPVLMVLGIFSLIGSVVCIGLYFVINNEYDQIIYLAGFFIFLVTAFLSLGMSKVSQMLFRVNSHD